MATLELPYIAGFFDGEGWCGAYKGGFIGIMIGNTDRGILEAIRQTLQVGHIYTQKNRLGTKPMWRWQVSKLEDIASAGRALLPYTRVKWQSLAAVVDEATLRLDRWNGKRKMPELTKEALHDLYWGQGLNTKEIGRLFGVNSKTVWVRLRRFGIPTRARYRTKARA